MRPAFCTYCGTKLEKDARFCPVCGMTVREVEASALPNSDVTVAAPALGSDVPEQPVAAGPDATVFVDPAVFAEPERAAVAEPERAAVAEPVAAASPAVTVVREQAVDGTAEPAPSAQPMVAAATPRARAVRTPRRPNDGIDPLILAGAGVAAVLLIIALFAGMGSCSRGAQNAEAPTQTTTTETVEPNVTTDITTDGTTATTEPEGQDDTEAPVEEEADELVISDGVRASYNALSSYDARISEVAATFNGLYLSTDGQARSDAYRASVNLAAEIRTAREELGALGVSTTSSWYTNYQLVDRCYGDLLVRLDCINQAWDVSLSYADPTEHADEILAPIAAANAPGTGSNAGKLDYENTYAQIDL